MIWYDKLYVSDNISVDVERIKRRMEKGRFRRTFGWYLILISDIRDGQLDIIPAEELHLPIFRADNRYVVGVAKGHWKAMQLVRQMTEDVFREQGDCCLKSFFLSQIGLKKKEYQDA